MAVSINDLVQRVRDLLNDSPKVITSTTTDTSTSLTVSEPTDLSEGDVLEWQTGVVGYEQVLITNANGGSNPITVVRGFNGTTAESHGSGDRLFINPSFTGRQVQQSLRVAMRALWPAVYKTETANITYDATKIWQSLDSMTAVPVGFVRIEQTFGASPMLYEGQYRPRRDPRGCRSVVARYDLSTTHASDGVGLWFPDGVYHPTNQVRVIAQVLLTGSTDIEDSEQLPVADALVYEVVGLLTQALEVPRVAQGGDLESSSVVGTGARTQTGSYYFATARRMRESLRLAYEMKYRPVLPGTYLQ